MYRGYKFFCLCRCHAAAMPLPCYMSLTSTMPNVPFLKMMSVSYSSSCVLPAKQCYKLLCVASIPFVPILIMNNMGRIFQRSVYIRPLRKYSQARHSSPANDYVHNLHKITHIDLFMSTRINHHSAVCKLREQTTWDTSYRLILCRAVACKENLIETPRL